MRPVSTAARIAGHHPEAVHTLQPERAEPGAVGVIDEEIGIEGSFVGEDFQSGIETFFPGVPLGNVVGGEIDEYTKLQAQSREQALQRMKDDAEKLNADAIVNIRFETSAITQGSSEILAYGAAVKLAEL